MFNIQLEPTIVKPLIGRSRAELNNVDTSGLVAQMDITKYAEITQVHVKHIVGNSSYKVEIFSDEALSDKVFYVESNDGADLLVNKIGLMFENLDSPEKKNLLYLRVTPTTENQDFKVAVFFNKH